MASKQTTLQNIFIRYKKEAGDESITQLDFIRDLNDLLQRMKLTKPAERINKIYYVDGFENYTIEDDCRDSIAMYPKNIDLLFYVSPFKFRVGDIVNCFTDQVDSGVKYLKIKNPYTTSQKVIATNCDDLTADGTWAITGGSSLAIDTNTKEEGAGSLSFSVSGTQTILTFTKTAVIDASTFTEHMVERLYAWFPTLPASVKLRVGNDSSNYFEQTLTKQVHGMPFTTADVNELELREDQSTETGTVDKENIDWLEIELNFATSTTDTDFKLNYIVLAKPEIIDHEYYTNYIGINSAGVLIEKITESAQTVTDEPLIKDYPDYINVLVAGLCFEFLRLTNPDRATKFDSEYKGVFDQDKLAIGGMALLNRRYPDRRANYKRTIQLPPLYQGVLRNNR